MSFDGRVFKQRKKYHTPENNRKYFGKDNNEAVRQIELWMCEECERRKLDWSTIDKYDLAKKLGIYKEYYNALLEKRIYR